MALFVTDSSIVKKIQFKVPAVPVPQPRARASGFGGKVRVHDVTTIVGVDPEGNKTRKPHPIVAFKATVRHAFAAIYQGPPLDCPIAMFMEFVLPRPESKIWKSKPMPREPHTTKGDLDNLIKGVWDALNGLAFVDDKRIYRVDVSKWIASGDEQPHCVIRIETGGSY